jgi:hypothetical protein
MRILLYGATGRTGQALAARLAERGLTVVLGGRSAERLAALSSRLPRRPPWLALELEDQGALMSGLEVFDWVLSCAGPFTKTAPILARAAIAASVDYADLTGEAESVRLLEALGADAVRAGVRLTPGLGVVGTLGDGLAEVGAARLGAPPEGIDIVYAQTLGQMLTMSSGSLRSALGRVARGPSGSRPGARLRIAIDLPLPFGPGWGLEVDGPERVLIRRRFPACRARTFFSPHPGHRRHAWLAAGLERAAEAGGLQAWADGPWGRAHRTLCGRLARAREGPAGGAVLARARGRGRAFEQVTLFGDAYETTARLVAAMFARVPPRTSGSRGLLAPGQLVDLRGVLRELDAAGELASLARFTDDRTR